MEKCSLTAISRENTIIIKGLAILFILLGHASYIPYGGIGGVGLFLLISGYGLNESAKAKGFDGYWVKRIKTVYIPYFFVALLQLLAFGAERKLVIVVSLAGLDLTAGDRVLNIDPTMWYISYIFFWYLSFYICGKLGQCFKNRRLGSGVKLLGLFALSLLCRKLYARGLWDPYSNAGLYVWLFPLGVLLSELSELKVSKTVRQSFWALLFLVSTAHVFSDYPEHSAYTWLSMPFQLLAAVQLVNIGGFIGRALRWLGTYSYSIYLMEGMTVMWHSYEWFGNMDNVHLINAVAFAVTMVLAWLYWEGIYKKLLAKIPLERLAGKRPSVPAE